MIINGTFPSVAALPRPPATSRLGDLKSFVLLVFFLCMSHVVGEVTYVELFKDAEGKSRVSDVANMLHEVLNALSRFSFIKCSYRL